MKIKIKKAELSDCEAISFLSKELGYEQNDISETTKRLTTLLDSENDEVFVAIYNNLVVGWIHAFITYRLESDSFVEIGGLVVSSKSRNLGIGKQLVNEVVLMSKKLNCKIRVRCNSKRTQSHKFYEAIKFENIKRQHVFEKKRDGI